MTEQNQKPKCQEMCYCGILCGQTGEHAMHECRECNRERQSRIPKLEKPVFDPSTDIEEGFADDRICASCDGTGEVDGRLCRDCGGRVYK
jgi:hypothetical protein